MGGSQGALHALGGSSYSPSPGSQQAQPECLGEEMADWECWSSQLGPSGLGQPWGAYWGPRLGAGSYLSPALWGLWAFASGLRHPDCAASGSAGTGAAGSRALLQSLTEQQPRVLLAAPSALPAAPWGGSAASTSGQLHLDLF